MASLFTLDPNVKSRPILARFKAIWVCICLTRLEGFKKDRLWILAFETLGVSIYKGTGGQIGGAGGY